MDFRKFLEMVAEKDLTEAKKKKPDKDGDGVPDWADKKPGEDDHAEDKKDKKDKKKSLKDWIDTVEKQVISEMSTIGAKPIPVLDPKTNKASGAGVITSKNPSVDKLLKSLDPKDVQVMMTTQGSQPIGGATQSATTIEEEEVEESGLQAYLGKKKYGEKGMKALQKAGREGASKEKMAKIRAQHDKLDEADRPNYWVHDEKEDHYYGPYSSESSAREGGRVGPGATIKKFPSSVRNPRTLHPSSTRMANVGKGGASGTKMNEKAPPGREKQVKKLKGKVDNPYAVAWASYNKSHGKKEESVEESEQWIQKATAKGKGDFAAKAKAAGKSTAAYAKEKADAPGKLGKQARLAQTLGKLRKKKANEADIPPNDSLMSPISESKTQVNESMQKNHKAAYHEGYTHGLREQPCRVKHYSDMDEAKQYFEGYKCGLEECYGMSQSPVIGETTPPATVPGMASQAMTSTPSLPAMEGDMDEGNAFGKAVRAAKADGIQPGEKITVGGNTYPVKETDAFAFESLDKQLEDLLKEDKEVVNEGLSVNMSQGLGNMGDDTVSVSATGDDASKLLDFIKTVGLGGLGGAEAAHGEPAVLATVSDYGAPKHSGSDEMAALMKKVGVDDEGSDYKPEGGADHEHSDSCGCDKVDEVESADQRLYNVAEDDGEGYEQSQADAGKIDSALAMSGASKGGATNEGGDGGEASEEPIMSEESKDEEDDHAEKAGKEVAKDIEHDEGHKGKDDNKAERAGEKVTKDIEYDDKKDAKEKVDEWANDAGKKGTDAAFEEDINFMTKVISGGLNKPKATGQTTIPVIAGQNARVGESMDDAEVVQWKRLAGLA